MTTEITDLQRRVGIIINHLYEELTNPSEDSKSNDVTTLQAYDWLMCELAYIAEARRSSQWNAQTRDFVKQITGLRQVIMVPSMTSHTCNLCGKNLENSNKMQCFDVIGPAWKGRVQHGVRALDTIQHYHSLCKARSKKGIGRKGSLLQSDLGRICVGADCAIMLLDSWYTENGLLLHILDNISTWPNIHHQTKPELVIETCAAVEWVMNNARQASSKTKAAVRFPHPNKQTKQTNERIDLFRNTIESNLEQLLAERGAYMLQNGCEKLELSPGSSFWLDNAPLRVREDSEDEELVRFRPHRRGKKSHIWEEESESEPEFEAGLESESESDNCSSSTHEKSPENKKRKCSLSSVSRDSLDVPASWGASNAVRSTRNPRPAYCERPAADRLAVSTSTMESSQLAMRSGNVKADLPRFATLYARFIMHDDFEHANEVNILLKNVHALVKACESTASFNP